MPTVERGLQLDKLAKLPRAARLGIAPALCALLFGAYGYFLFMPARAERVAAREQQLQLQRRLAEVRAVAGNEEQVKAEIASLDRRLKEALRQLPNGKELPGLLTDVSSLGKNAGLDFKSFRPGGEVRKVSLALTGALSQAWLTHLRFDAAVVGAHEAAIARRRPLHCHTRIVNRSHQRPQRGGGVVSLALFIACYDTKRE